MNKEKRDYINKVRWTVATVVFVMAFIYAVMMSILSYYPPENIDLAKQGATLYLLLAIVSLVVSVIGFFNMKERDF